MLPLFLGGIALAAVGYGVKEYCESEECPWESGSGGYRDNADRIWDLNAARESIHTDVVRPYHARLASIAALGGEWALGSLVLEDEDVVLDDWEDGEWIDRFTETMESLARILSRERDRLDTILEVSRDLEVYSEDARRRVVGYLTAVWQLSVATSTRILSQDGRIEEAARPLLSQMEHEIALLTRIEDANGYDNEEG